MSILKNFNYVKRAMRQPCASPSPLIMIETAFEAALPLLFVPFTFSCTDWVKSSVGISWKCGRKLKAVAKHVYGPKFTDGVHFFYEVSGAAAIENALWIWFVADLAVDFAANWMSLMYEEQRCDLPGAGTFQCGLNSIFTDSHEISTMFIDGLGGVGCASIGGNKIAVQPGCYIDISYTAEWRPFGDNPANAGSVTTWIAKDDGTLLDESTSGKSSGGSKNMTGGFYTHLDARIIAGTEYHIAFRVNSGLMGCSHGSLTVSAHGKPMPLIPSGCFSSLGRKLGIG